MVKKPEVTLTSFPSEKPEGNCTYQCFVVTVISLHTQDS